MATNIYTLDLENLGDVNIGQNENKIKFSPLKFTQNNRDLILACIDIDSTYRLSFNPDNPKSSAYIISKWFGDPTKYNEYKSMSVDEKIKIIKDVCYRIDKENATHLSVSSMYSDNNKENKNKKPNIQIVKDALGKSNSEGIDIMAEEIVKKYSNNILEKLEEDTTGEIVDEISQLVKDTKRKTEDGKDIVLNKLSFASKFCTYMSRYAFKGGDNNDKYSIYDSVLCSILPYYIWKYQDYVEEVQLTQDMLTKTGKNSIANLTKTKGYNWYRNIIDNIRKGIKEESSKEGELGMDISRREFDLMLWYYYKGDNELIDAAYTYLRNKLS